MTKPTKQTNTPTESALADMWNDLLERRDIGAQDDFFLAGGNSLTAIKLLQRVEKRFGPDTLSPDALYTDPRLGAVAAVIDRARSSKTGTGPGAGLDSGHG